MGIALRLRRYLFSATGAAFNLSLGHRPRESPQHKIEALQARFVPQAQG